MIGGQLVVILAAFAIGAITPAMAETFHWYRGNTHTHTTNSDGEASPQTVARWYKEHDYQFLFLTDHEFVTDAASLNSALGAAEHFLVLPGQEVTQWIDDPRDQGTMLGSAHVNALFARRVVWPLGVRKCLGMSFGACTPPSTPIAETFRVNIDAIRAEGAIAQVNHPNLLWTVRPKDLLDIPDGTLIEIWNGVSIANNLGGSDGSGDVRPSAEGTWDVLLSKGKLIWGVGSDDSHSEAQRGQAWIVVRAPALTPSAIRSAIVHGEFYASNGVVLEDVRADQTCLGVEIEHLPGIPGIATSESRYLTRFIGQGGSVLAEVPGTHPIYHFRGAETYVRAAIIDSNGKRAWTQPVFLDGREKKRVITKRSPDSLHAVGRDVP